MATLSEDDDEQSTNGAEHVEVEQDPKDEHVEVVEDTGDERIASESDDDTGEEERPRHRETAAQRRERAKKAKLRDKQELDFQRREMARMEKKLQDLESRQTVTHVTDLDTRIAAALNEAETMDKVHAKAIKAANGDDAVLAQNIKAQALDKVRQLQWEKQQLVEAAQRPQSREPSYAGLAKEFMNANPWYNHTGADEDSLIVKAIDTAVAKEYNPNTPEYWEALQARVAKRLPHHFQADSDEDDEPQVRQQTRRQGPPVGGSSRSNSTTSTSQIRLSPERVEAMKEAGLWDDPKTRARMAKKYAEFDRNNRS